MNISLPVPNEIEKSLRDFKADYPYPEKVGFIMMRFSDTETQHNIIKAIKESAKTYGIEALIADERTYNSLLVLNVKTYMWGCDFGFAVFDHISSKDEEYNPNVALEVGYMHALQKRICLLKRRIVEVLTLGSGRKNILFVRCSRSRRQHQEGDSLVMAERRRRSSKQQPRQQYRIKEGCLATPQALTWPTGVR